MQTQFQIANIFCSLQGEGLGQGRVSSFIRFQGCPHACNYCFVKGTRILMGDYSWKSIENVKIGDIVIANKDGTLVKSPVTNVMSREKETVEVVFETGQKIKCTPNHRFLASHSRWRSIEKLLGKRVRLLNTVPNEETKEFRRGWLAGIIAGDGCVWTCKPKCKSKGYKRIRLALKDADVFSTFIRWANEFGFNFYTSTHTSKYKNKKHTLSCVYLTKHKEVERFEKEILYTNILETEYCRGWIAGMIDAEGSVSKYSVRLYQNSGKTAEKIEEFLTFLGYPFSKKISGKLCRYGLLKKSVKELYLDFRWQIERKKQHLFLHKKERFHRSKVSAVIPQGLNRVYNLTVAEGNYVAEGFFVHNCDTPKAKVYENYKMPFIASQRASVGPFSLSSTKYFINGDKATEDILRGHVTHYRDMLFTCNDSISFITDGPFTTDLNTIQHILDFFGSERLCITGGEPMIYPQAVQSLIEANPEKLISVETSGLTQIDPAFFKKYDHVSWEVDFKPCSSGEHCHIKKEIYGYLQPGRDEIKVMVSSPTDIAVFTAFISSVGFSPGLSVGFYPISGITQQTMKEIVRSLLKCEILDNLGIVYYMGYQLHRTLGLSSEREDC